MSIEALFAVRFGHVGAPYPDRNGGVVVLESGRLFGGDSWYAYTGHYSVAGAHVTGQLHAVRHFQQPGTQSAWGTQEAEFDVQFDVHVNDTFSEANGTISRGSMALGAKLIRVAELP
jgi:hypothetical protein